MADTFPRRTPQVSPYLLYEDGAAALDWLTQAFGFRERLRFTDEDGRVTHAELEVGEDVIMLGQPGSEYQSPKRSGHTSAIIHVYLEDVDGHFERARAAGATILAEPSEKEYGDRQYSVEDPEGHQWFFSQKLQEVAPEDWGAAEA
jgi:uncharacterized glyoxalase superfamily protein PhnB